MIIPTFKLEEEILSNGYSLIAGIDEAGRGPWAGPLVAAAVVLDIKNFKVDKVRDSKLLSPKQRSEIFEEIKNQSLAFSIGEVSSEEIDNLGLQLANKTAMKRAIEGLSLKPDYILTDYVGRIAFRTPFKIVIRGDKYSVSIAAASILAKVHRDTLMIELAKLYPEYGFEQHKGYGTALHQQKIKEHGLCPIHRRCFGPIKEFAKKQNLA